MAANSVVIDLQIRSNQARRALQGIESGMTNLRKSSGKATSMVKRSSGAMAGGFNRASQKVQGSTAAVSNLSRIVEDAPFGIRGVANNINPFIDSFQRMGNESTTTAQKLKTLITSAFTGPGALLVISALVTSAMTAIQMGLFDMGEEAKDTLEELDTLLNGFDRVIEIQEEFGAFEDDQFGIAKTQAEIREITEDIQIQRDRIKEIRDLEAERRDIQQQAARGEQIDQERLTQINAILDRELSVEDIEENINNLQKERFNLSQELLNTADALADADTQRARAAQQAREEAEKSEEAAEGELKAVYSLRQARQDIAGANRPQRPEDILLGASGEEFAAGDDSKFGTDFRIDVEFGRTMQEIEKFGEKIGMTDREIEQMKINLANTGTEGEASMQAITGAANMLGNALAQAIIRGEELEGVLKSLAAQLASRAIVTGLGALLTSGASLGGQGFLTAMFGGFAHGTDMGFPGMGKVGERGEELIVAPPFSSIITNENVERMERMREGARDGMSLKNNSLNPQVIENAIIKGMSMSSVNVSADEIDEGLGTLNDKVTRING